MPLFYFFINKFILNMIRTHSFDIKINIEIIGRVRQPIGGVLFRPPLGGLAARPSVLAVLKACWSERPDRRPDVRLVRLRLKDMHAGM